MKIALALLALTFCVGCANDYYTSYREAHPTWYGEFPKKGAALDETLAWLHGPRAGDHNVMVTKLGVLALRGDGFEELVEPEIEAALTDENGTLAIVAMQFCHSEAVGHAVVGEKVSWFLLRQGKLAAYDAYLFTDDRCTVHNEFAPGGSDAIALENGVIEYRDAKFPPSMVHVGEVYRRGLAYADRGRIEEARAMLSYGDSSLDVADRGRRHVHGWQPTHTSDGITSDEIEGLRRRLVETLQRTEAADVALGGHPKEAIDGHLKSGQRGGRPGR